LSRSKRFQQIETPGPEGKKKPSLLGKLFFKRRIEIAGKAREVLPETPQSPPVPETPPATPPPLPTDQKIEIEHRVELENLSKKIESGEENKNKKMAQQLREIEIMYAKQQVQQAKTRLWASGAILGVLIPVFIVLIRNRASFGSESLFILIALVLSFLRNQNRR
jgi:hypothetical protein